MSFQIANPLSGAVIFDPASHSVSDTGSMSTSRSGHTATLLPDGEVLVVGGITWQEAWQGQYFTATQEETVGSAERYDPGGGEWTSAASPNVPRIGHTATLLADGRVLVAGGLIAGPDGTIVSAAAELYGDAVMPPVTIGPGFTGTWYDPAQSGHGLFIEVLPDNRFYAAWFAFNPTGTAQAWFTGVGTYSGNTATITAVEQPTGGRWIPNFDPSQIVRNAWGTLTFTFTDCNHGTVNFDSMIGYGTGSMNLTRLTRPARLTCP